MIASLVRFLRSVKLAVVLIILLALGGVLGGFLPQGAAASVFVQAHPKLSRILQAGGMFDFFRSPLFFATAGLFLLNLGTCTAHRLSAQLKKKGRDRRFGPDILHLGLLVLALGAVLGAGGRKNYEFWLAPGDAAVLPDGRSMRLVDFDYKTYPDGRPEAWISRVEISPKIPGGKPLGATIEVNHPLRLGTISVYQTSYANRVTALFESPLGSVIRLSGGEKTTFGPDGSVFFMAEQGEGEARIGLFILENAAGKRVFRIGPGGELAGWRLLELKDAEMTGLRASADPGYGIVLAGFILIAAGLILTYIQKIKDMHR